MIRGGESDRVLDDPDQGIGDRSVLQIARKVAATIGSDFFVAIARHLAKELGADCVVICEFLGGQMERVRTLAATLDGQPASFEYVLAGSASMLPAVGKPCLCRADAQTRFPDDALLRSVSAQACVGLPLADTKGHPRGLIMALFRRPVTSFRVHKEILEIFSARASAELNRKLEEEELRKSDQRHRAFIARNPDAMWRIELEQAIDTGLPELEQLALLYRYGYMAECNDALAQLCGRTTADQLIGCRIDEIAPVSDPSIREANLLAIRSKSHYSVVETNLPDQDGRSRHMLRSQWGIVEDGKLERIWGTTRDITKLKHSEQALDASEQRMIDLLETVQLVVVMLNLQGTIAFCNQYFYQVTGWQPSEVMGRDLIDLMIPAEEQSKLRALFAGEMLQPEHPLHFQSTVLDRAGRRRQFEWDRTVLRDAHGQTAAWANVGRDVTEYKALEVQFRQAQKLASVGRLAGGLAHDFNNLLTVILGYSASLLQKCDPSDSAYTSLMEIRNAAGHGAELTHRLLAFSRRQVLRPRVVNLNAIIVEAGLMLRRLIGEDVHLTMNLDRALGSVRADAGSLHQVLMNLAVNARDAMPEGGDLTISTSNVVVEVGTPRSSAVAPGDYVELAVADVGVGMSEEVRSHLFEPFFSTKEQGKGTGLGLSTVFGIVQQTGGGIVVETELGKGTTFRILLPRAPAEPISDREEAVETVTQHGTETILLVEDQQEVRKLAAGILTSLRYTVLVAETPERALELAQDRSRTIHLLLTDVIMPGMPGTELADLIKTYQAGIKVLFVSGYGEASHVSERISRPGFGFLQKPFTPEALAIKLREVLDQR